MIQFNPFSFFRIFSIWICVFSNSFGLCADLPFWQSKENVFRRIRDERAIVVSVLTKKIDKKSSMMTMQGGALVRTAADAAHLEAQNYENLSKLSSYIKEVRHNKAKNEVFLHCVAFNYHEKMTLLMSTETVNDKNKRLNFLVTEGNFKGMKGYFNFNDFEGKTLLGFFSEFTYGKLPMPEFFIQFGLEFVLERVAKNMREHLEKETQHSPTR